MSELPDSFNLLHNWVCADHQHNDQTHHGLYYKVADNVGFFIGGWMEGGSYIWHPCTGPYMWFKDINKVARLAKTCEMHDST